MTPSAPDASPFRWSAMAAALTRPYPVTAPMIVLMALVPFYIFIAEMNAGRTVHAPELPLDGLVPLRPAWALVYGTLYLFLILLPVFVVRQEDHIRRTFSAYVAVWVAAYFCFLIYPTVAPRPTDVAGTGFAAWGLRFLYEADPPYNCFPSLHVAHSFVSALTCHRVHPRLGSMAVICASLVGLSTLFTKQHYILDVIAGVLMACTAYFLLLHRSPRGGTPALDRHLAPAAALAALAFVGFAFACYWMAYLLSGRV